MPSSIRYHCNKVGNTQGEREGQDALSTPQQQGRRRRRRGTTRRGGKVERKEISWTTTKSAIEDGNDLASPLGTKNRNATRLAKMSKQKMKHALVAAAGFRAATSSCSSVQAWQQPKSSSFVRRPATDKVALITMNNSRRQDDDSSVPSRRHFCRILSTAAAAALTINPSLAHASVESDLAYLRSLGRKGGPRGDGDDDSSSDSSEDNSQTTSDGESTSSDDDDDEDSHVGSNEDTPILMSNKEDKIVDVLQFGVD